MTSQNPSRCIQYIVPFGDKAMNFTKSEQAFLKKYNDVICHKWCWWSGDNPFGKYRKEFRTNPMWNYYEEKDCRLLESGYKDYLRDFNKERCDFNPTGGYCARFNCTYKDKWIMVQGKIEDEDNSSVEETRKRRRPIARVSFLWFFSRTNDPCLHNWQAFAPEISTLLEGEYAKGNDRPGRISYGDFDFKNRTLATQAGIFFLARFGTTVKSAHQLPLPITPLSWTPQAQKFLYSETLSDKERDLIREMISNSGINGNINNK